MPGALRVVVGLKGENNWCSSWKSLVMGSTVLGKENASYLSSSTMEVRREDEVVLVVVSGIAAVEVFDWQLLTMAKRSQSSSMYAEQRDCSFCFPEKKKMVALTFGGEWEEKEEGLVEH